MIEVREATSDELIIVHHITLEAFEEFRGKLDPPTGAISETIEDVIETASQGGTFLAFMNGEPVGTGRYVLYDDHLYCGRLGVLPAHRGKGVGTAMLHYVDQAAIRNGRHRVTIATREVMQDNVRLYQRHGYEITSIHVHEKGGGRVVRLEKCLDRQA